MSNDEKFVSQIKELLEWKKITHLVTPYVGVTSSLYHLSVEAKFRACLVKLLKNHVGKEK